MSKSVQQGAESRSSYLPGWLIGVIILLLVAAVLYFGFRTLESSRESVGAEVQMTPVVGGMEAPTTIPTTAANTFEAATSNQADDEEASDGPKPLVLVPGETVEARHNLRLYADVTTEALVLDSYVVGDEFELMEPGGDYDEYPVQREDQKWIRLRAADGLVGWTTVDRFEP